MPVSLSLHPPELDKLLQRFRLTLCVFIAGLVLSGITCFALPRETTWMLHSPLLQQTGLLHTEFGPWLGQVQQALVQQSEHAPFLLYGTDWLGFAHIVIAMAFLGLLVHPVRNRWLIDFGLLSCGGVFLLALVAGPVRNVPFFWRLVDCSFGAVGGALLLLCRHYLSLMERLRANTGRQRRRTRRVRRMSRLPRKGASS